MVSAASAGLAAAGLAGLELQNGVSTKTKIQAINEPPNNGSILVVLSLYGGNDGLNTVVPFTDPLYHQLRSNMALRNDQVASLGIDGLSLNSSMPKLFQLYNANKLAIVRGVSYPNPNLSHFVSMAIWQSANPTDSSSVGWIGRYLDQVGSTDPMRVLCLGSNIPLACRGEKTQASAISVSGTPIPPFVDHLSAFESLMKTQDRTQMLEVCAREGRQLLNLDDRLRSLHLGAAASTDLSFTDLSAQLTAVAQLINANAGTQIYSVSESSFDTHSNEVALQNALLARVDSAIGTFFEKLQSNLVDKVTMIAYSEFGRRVASNASGGTDHGTSGPVFVIGNKVKGGLYGEQPSLSNLIDGNQATTIDFRRIYATLIEGVLGHSSRDILATRFDTLDMLNA